MYNVPSANTVTRILLQDGVPMRDLVGPRGYEYFKIKVVDPAQDLSISVTPFSGDPDLFVGTSANPHPSKNNHTWAARGFGADTLTLQASDMGKYCTPKPARGLGCDYFVGVYGWTNTSFSILATTRKAWSNPVLLFKGQPQSGNVEKSDYVYYKFHVPSDGPNATLHITLTPMDSNDQDLYVSMSREKQPGEVQNLVKSWEHKKVGRHCCIP